VWFHDDAHPFLDRGQQLDWYCLMIARRPGASRR
jgi:hypothetical protein